MASVHRAVPLDVSRASRRVGGGRLAGHAMSKGRRASFPACSPIAGSKKVRASSTFANGLVAREPIIEMDEARRRLVYAVVGGRMTHHNASLQVFEVAEGACRVAWIADFLADAMQGAVGALTDAGVAAMQCALVPHAP